MLRHVGRVSLPVMVVHVVSWGAASRVHHLRRVPQLVVVLLTQLNYSVLPV